MSDIRCPDCGRKVSITTSTGSRVTRCPKCGFAIKPPGEAGSGVKVEPVRETRLSPLPFPSDEKVPEPKKERVAVVKPEEKPVEKPVTAAAVPKEPVPPPAPEPPRKEKEPSAAPPSPKISEKPQPSPVGGLDKLAQMGLEKNSKPATSAAEVKKSPSVEVVSLDKPAAREPEPEKPVSPMRLTTAGESLDRLERFATEALASETRLVRREEKEKDIASSREDSATLKATQAGEEEASARDADVPVTEAPRDMDDLARDALAEQEADQATEKVQEKALDNLTRAAAQIDTLFGQGFARQHPELVTAALQAQAAEAGTAELLKRLDALEARLAGMERRLEGKG